MTTPKRSRKTKDELIADLEAKLKKLKSGSVKPKAAELTPDSPGMAELVATFDAALKLNGVKSPELIIALAKAKRARVTIAPIAPKSRAQSFIAE